MSQNESHAQYRCDFLDDTNYADLQTGMHPNFLAKFREGYAHYIDGNWDQARVVFEEVLEMPSANQYFDKDGQAQANGPTMQLMRYMSEHEFVAGKSWNGVHVMGRFLCFYLKSRILGYM